MFSRTPSATGFAGEFAMPRTTFNKCLIVGVPSAIAVWSCCVAGCSSNPSDTSSRAFEFHSGGAQHVEGFGEWHVTLDQQGTIHVQHEQRGQLQDRGSFPLAAPERDELWELVTRAGLEQLAAPGRPGLPDEPQYKFAYTSDGQRHEALIWASDARESESLMALVQRLAGLIEKYVHEQPVLN
jgi:hypothetical protein